MSSLTLAACGFVFLFFSSNFKFHRLLLFRKPGAAGLEVYFMQPWQRVVFLSEFFPEVVEMHLQLLVDGVWADRQPVCLICYYKLMFHNSCFLAKRRSLEMINCYTTCTRALGSSHRCGSLHKFNKLIYHHAPIGLSVEIQYYNSTNS